MNSPASAKFNKKKAESAASLERMTDAIAAIVGLRLRPAYELIDGQNQEADPEESAAMSEDELVGTEWLSDDPDDARVRVEIRDELRQPFGLMHGGVMSTLIESVCSRAKNGIVA